MADESLYCPDCHRATEVVRDHATGDTVCTECALVLDAHYIDEGSEWRNFADDGGGEDRDPSRVGGPNDPFLSNAPLVTRITYSGPQKAQAGGGHALPRMRVNVGGPDPAEQSLVEAFHAIADMADRLGLVATIRDGAKDVYKKLDEAKACPRGKKRDVFYAACLYIACRNGDSRRRLRQEGDRPDDHAHQEGARGGGRAAGSGHRRRARQRLPAPLLLPARDGQPGDARCAGGGAEAGGRPRRAPQPRVHRGRHQLHGRAARRRHQDRQGRVRGHRRRRGHHQGGAQGPHPAR